MSPAEPSPGRRGQAPVLAPPGRAAARGQADAPPAEEPRTLAQRHCC